MKTIVNIKGESRYLSVGNGCNLRCKYCYNDKDREDFTFFNNFSDLISIIDKMVLNNRRNVVMVGGEPLMHPKILDIFKYLKKQNFNQIFLVTNGIKFSDSFFVATVFSLGVLKDIKFSINAHNKNLDNVIIGRKGDDFLKRDKGIKNIVKLNKLYPDKKIKLCSNSVITSDNYKDLQGIIDYTYKLNIKIITLAFIYNLRGFSSDNIGSLVKYSDVIFNINKLKIEEDVLFKIDWLPYCLHSKITLLKEYEIREVMDYNDKSGYRNKVDYNKKYRNPLNECKKCSVYGKYCNGPFKSYVDKFGDKEFKAI